MSTKKTLVILAGGLGSRYNGLKQVDGILDNGSPILEYAIYDALEVGFTKVVCIINKMVPESYIERLKEIAAKRNFEIAFVYQNLEDFVPAGYNISERQKPWGTSHALLCAKDAVKEPFIILNADDFYGIESFRMAAEAIDNGEVDDKNFQLIAYQLEPTLSENGTVSRGVCKVKENGMLERVDERTAIAKEGDEIFFTEGDLKEKLAPETPVSMNFWVFSPFIFEFVEKKFVEFLNNNPAPKAEYFIPTTAQQLLEEGLAEFKVQTSPEQWMGVTYAADKPLLQEFLRNKIKEGKYPEQLW